MPLLHVGQVSRGVEVRHYCSKCGGDLKRVVTHVDEFWWVDTPGSWSHVNDYWNLPHWCGPEPVPAQRVMLYKADGSSYEA